MGKIKFKRAYPDDGKSYDLVITEEYQVVPDQSLSLQEILDRFVRNEELPVDMGGEYGDEDDDNPLNVDLEKLKDADLVDKAEYMEQLKEVKTAYDKQENQRIAYEQAEAEKKAKLAEEKRIRIAARKLAKGNSEKLA